MSPAFSRRRHLPIVLVGALACSSGGGAAPAPAPEPTAIATGVPAVRVERAEAPSFTAAATGNGWVDGSATAAVSSKYFRQISGVRGEVFELKGDATGDEKDKACGTDWRASTARSLVVVTPDGGARTIGFTLNATAFARRGTWRTKATLSCTTVNYTDAVAATMARGQAWITLGGGSENPDRLVIETGGSTSGEWALSVTDTLGQKYAAQAVGSTLVADLPGAGRYSVAASVTARAAAGADSKDSVEQRLRATVKVSSLRNALATALGAAPLPGLEVPFTIDIPAADLAVLMQGALTGYTPCDTKPGCGGKVSDLSAAAVTVYAAGGGAVVGMTMTGKKHAPTPALFIGSVEIRSDSFRVMDLRLADGQPQVSKKKDLAAAAALFAARVSSVSTPVEAERTAAEAAARAQFPVRVGDLCVAAPAQPGAFLGTEPATDSTRFVAWFGLTPSPLQPCAKSR